MSDRIELQPGFDIELVPTEGQTKLVVRVPSGTFARLADLLAATGPNWIGFDNDQAYEADSIGESVQVALNAVREIVTLPGHLGVQLVNDDTQIQLSLPQPIRTSDPVEFARVRARRIDTAKVTHTVSEGDIPANVAGAFSGGVAGGGWCFRLTVTPTAAPTSTAYPLAIANVVFAEPYDRAPLVVMIPANRNAAVLQASLATACGIDDGEVTTTGFRLRAGLTNATLTVGKTYQWWFIVTEVRV